MKKTFLYLAAALLTLASCAKAPVTNSNSTSKAYFDAWIEVNHPDKSPTPYGAYVLSETQGNGAYIGSANVNRYVRVEYTTSTLDGNISYSTLESVDKQIGNYSETANKIYVPAIWDRGNNALFAGLDEAVSTMRVGGKKKSAIPSWLFTTNRYEKAEDYVRNVTSSSNNTIYDIEIVETFNDIRKWEIDSLSNFVSRNYGINPNDSLKYGFYYKQKTPPANTDEFNTSDQIYIGYIGRLLNGQVFDTNNADTAKFYGIYNSGREYEPMIINWDADDYTQMTMSSSSGSSSSSSVVDGFAYTIHRMKIGEEGTGIFYSDLGYGSSGNGNSIPAYSPLIFDITILYKK